MASETEFAKYAARGAYHWEAFNRSVKRHSPFLAGRYALVVDMLKKSATPGASMLDIGCGDGALSFAITNAGYKVAALDYSGTGLGLAKEMFARHGARAVFFRGDSMRLPVRDASFDGVVAAEIIEHLERPESMLDEINRALVPGGTAIITTPVKLTETPLDREHVREFTEDEFRDMLGRRFASVELTLSHPRDVLERYERQYRLLGFMGRIRPYRYWYNFLSSYMGNNPFLKRREGVLTLMTARCVKADS